MVQVCRKKPNRTKPRHWRPRDVGRVLASARADGATDVELVAAVFEGFGARATLCLISRALDVLTGAASIGAMITILTGLLTIAKGIKAIATLSPPAIIRILLLPLRRILPSSIVASIGEILVVIGSMEVLLGALVGAVSALANSANLLSQLQLACEVKTEAYTKNSGEFLGARDADRIAGELLKASGGSDI